MVALTINGVVVTAKKGTLLVEAAKQVGIEIPVFCYHPKLKPVGACRMCLVEIEKMPRLQTACTTPVGPNMVVKTQSELAKGGQGAVISLLLANHPLDCPVCDKGGECPLQDNTFGYGPGVSKFEEDKRHNEKAFELSDKIVLDRERCILCYRCVRFHEEIPGDRALAVLDRGGHGEIGVLPGETYDSPFQGNTIDICPVGALTSRQYRFRSRPWDLKSHDSIACDDPVGSNIVVDTRDGRVLRVRPRENLDVNDEWISDRTRFGTVPLERTQRLGQPLVRVGSGADAGWRRTSWADALARASAIVKQGRPRWVVSPAVTNEAMAIAAQLGADRVSVLPGVPSRPVRGSIAAIARSKSILVAGFDPWSDIPMLALWIHKAVAQNGATLVVVNEKNGLFRDTKRWVKTDVKAALRDLDTKDLAAGPVTVLWGESLAHDPDVDLDALEVKLTREADLAFIAAPSRWVNGRGVVEVLGDKIARAAYVDDADAVVAMDALTAGFAPARARGVWFAHGLPDELNTADVPAWVDVVLPLAHPYEQGGSFTSLEGRVQAFAAAGIAPSVAGLGAGEGAQADWAALARFSGELGAPLSADVRVLREQLGAKVPLLTKVPRLPPRRLTVV
jgi:NADH dehydrogenase/NADH:ubiquinone oxidoreductase subunit G